jgi:hypothetical protein
MSFIMKRMILNTFQLPREIIHLIQDYAFRQIKKISENDCRYDLLLTIPTKEYYPDEFEPYVYITITDCKDYFIVYTDYQLQLHTYEYGDDDVIYLVDCTIYYIK